MSKSVVVLGSGYAGTSAIKELEKKLNEEINLIWISDRKYHLVLHEVHRCIRDTDIKEKITIPVEDIKSRDTKFINGKVKSIDRDSCKVNLDDGTTVEYDYVLICLGSSTAFYGIEGLKKNASTLKSLEDALNIHNSVLKTSNKASDGDPAKIVIGGAGLSGIQVTGELAELKKEKNLPIEIYLIEQAKNVFPGHNTGFQKKLQNNLEKKGIKIKTNHAISKVDNNSLYFQDKDSINYDELIWTGGIKGPKALETSNLEGDHNRVRANQTFQTNDEKIFAVGDTACVDWKHGDIPIKEEKFWDIITSKKEKNPSPPPTAQAAWSGQK